MTFATAHTTTNDRARAWAVLILALGQVFTTFWSALGWGQSVQERTEPFMSPIMPIGWTFSIWGVIYLGAMAYGIWQFLPSARSHILNRRIGWLIAYMYLVNTLWQVWVSMVGFGLVDYLALASEAAVGTLVLFRISQIDRGPGNALGDAGFWLGVAPVGLLTGWTTAASFVGVMVSAQALGLAWGTSAPVGLGVLLSALVLGMVITLVLRQVAYGLAIAWAFWGVFSAQSTVDETAAGVAISWLTLLGTVLLLVVGGWLVVQRLRASPTP